MVEEEDEGSEAAGAVVDVSEEPGMNSQMR
jgi:hypothetical protein